MTRRTRLLPFSFAIAALGALLVTNSTFAGPNAGGTLILHTNPSLVYCQGLTYCGQTGITSCDQANVRHDGGSEMVFFALAAFPLASSPRLQAVSLSLEYDGAELSVFDFGMCGDFQLLNGGWPGPGSYASMTWNSAQTDHLVELYWFAAYAYNPPTPTYLRLAPTRGATFADDSVPAELDYAIAFGELGFNQPGVLPCPDAPPPLGACCLGCSCTVVPQTECDAMGGTFMGPNTSCSPNICGEPPAVCCVNEQCTIVTSCECQALGGEYFPGTDTCSPNPCEPLGACCLGCDCIRMRASECTAQGGEFHGAESSCDPSPCGTGPAACCVGESCTVVTSCGCEELGGEYLSDVPTCDGDPCVAPTPTQSETWGRVKARYR